MAAPRSILVPVDFSDPSARALAFAVDLAMPLGARVQIVSAYERLSDEAANAELVEATLRSVAIFAREHEGRGVEIASRVEEGDPRDVILALQESLGADLVVMGTHGRKGVLRALLGSVAEHVIRSSAVPVLTLH